MHLIGLAFVILMFYSMVKMFQKAGEKGWYALIPIWNLVVMTRIAGHSEWFFFLLLIPLVNIWAAWMIYAGISRGFGKGLGFTLGLLFLFPVFICILGLSEARYTRPNRGAAPR